MSSKKPIRLRNTLAFRLTLWYAGIFTVSSCIVSLLFYALINSILREQTDQELLSEARRYSNLVAFAGIETAEGDVTKEVQDMGAKGSFLRLLAENGRTLSSSNMFYWEWMRVDQKVLDQLLARQHPVFETVAAPGGKEDIRVLYAPIQSGIILQAAKKMESSSRFLEAFKRTFIFTMVFLTGIAAVVGWFMARRAVSGVQAVTRTAQNISAGALEARVPVKVRGDEIDQLAITFNQMLDRIQALVNEIREMSENLAHDLRGSVTRMRGAAEVTLSGGKSTPEYENLAAGTVEECDRLLDMINTMLLISKTEAGVDKPFREEIKLTSLLREACELFAASAEDQGISLDCAVSEETRISGDARMVQRMFSNLLDNAIKYTPAGGAVAVALLEKDDRVSVSVRDTGAGIPAADLPHIFERFYRGNQARLKPGMGLGLSLARAVARAHGGIITVASAPDQGSTFTVTLPKSLPAESHPVSSPTTH